MIDKSTGGGAGTHGPRAPFLESGHAGEWVAVVGDAEMMANVHRLVHLRWLLLGGALSTSIIAPTVLDIPVSPALPPIVVALAAFNLLAARRLRGGRRLQPATLCAHIAIDLLALGAMFHFAGGASNPLVSLMLLPVAAAALMLSWQLAVPIATLAIGIYSALTIWYVPLHIHDDARAMSLHLSGMWLTFVVSVVLISWLIARMTSAIRERDLALATAREHALRIERVVALGTLAAGAAHELGTPLGTMAILIGEIERDHGLPKGLRRDVAVLKQQLAICKGIVTRLVDRAGVPRQEDAHAAAAGPWLQAVVTRWRATRPRASCSTTVAPAGELQIVVDAALEQAISNLLNNAADSGGGDIVVRLAWNADALTIEVADDGPGFPDHVLAKGGLVPLQSATGGAGIGLLLVRTSLARLGGRLVLVNGTPHGAVARIELPLSALAVGAPG